MPIRVPGKGGNSAGLEFTLAEMAGTLGVEEEALVGWGATLPAAREQAGARFYRVSSKRDLEELRKRAQILRTGMSESSIATLQKRNLLDAYAALATDCPPGVTAHAWRSYGLVVLMQARHGVMIGAEELAQRAKIEVAMAEKHLQLLTGFRHLRPVKAGEVVAGKPVSEARWEHNGLPSAWSNRAA